MCDNEPGSGYNLPPGCFEHDIDAYFGEGKPTCAECKHMVECCCDYGICTREFNAAFGRELYGHEIPIDVATWALNWTSDHMRDMQSVACEHFLALQRIEKEVNRAV